MHPALSKVSLDEAIRLLLAFQSSPFYDFFTSTLQAKADAAVASVVAGFTGARDLAALVEREQVIGSTTAYLAFAQSAQTLLTELQHQLQEQNGPQ